LGLIFAGAVAGTMRGGAAASSAAVLAPLVIFGFWILVPWLYYAIFESAGTQATPGKLALGLRVVTEGGEPLGFGAATGRFFGKLVSGFTLYIGYLMVLFTERRQALHDKMAGALVVKRSWPVDEIAQAGPAPKSSAALAIVIVAVAFIFIIGMLAAIAIPAYQDYTIRSQVTEGLNVAAAYKAAVAEAAANGEAFSAMTTDSLQLTQPSPAKYVERLDVVNGAVHIQYGGQVNHLIAGKSVVLTPGIDAENNIVWLCGYREPPAGVAVPPEVEAAPTTVPQKYLPQACRPSPQ